MSTKVKPQSSADLLVFVFGRLGSLHASKLLKQIETVASIYLFVCSDQILTGFNRFKGGKSFNNSIIKLGEKKKTGLFFHNVVFY